MADQGTGLEFKNKFRNIAETQLKEDSPKLSDSVIGFELIDKVDGGNRAAGAVALRVGNKWCYTPVFWFDGDIAGTEMMYCKQWDKFIPTRDPWIKALKNNSMDEWAHLSPPGVKNGTRADQSTFSNIFTNSKYASITDCLQKISRSTVYPRDDLRDLVSAGNLTMDGFNPKLVLVDSTYDKLAKYFNDVVRPRLEEEAAKEPAKKKGGLRILTDIVDPDAKKLGDSEKKALARNGWFIVDDRDNNAHVMIKKSVEATQFQIPTADGLYCLVTSDGGGKDAMVFKSTGEGSSGGICCGPCGGSGDTAGSAKLPLIGINSDKVLEKDQVYMLVVPMDGSGRFTREQSKKLFGTVIDQMPESENKEPGEKATAANLIKLAKDYQKDQPYKSDKKDFGLPEYKDYLLLHDDCEPIEFHITNSYAEDGEVAFMARVDGKDCDVAFVDEDVAPGLRGTILYIPENARLLIRDEACFRHGDMDAILGMLFDKQQPADVSVFFNGTGYKIKARVPSDEELKKGLDGSDTRSDYWEKKASVHEVEFNGEHCKKAAIVHLATAYGIHASVASNMLTEAWHLRNVGPADYLVKTAQLENRTSETWNTTAGNPGAGEVLTDLNRLNNGRTKTYDDKNKEKATLRKLLDTSVIEEIVAQKDVSQVNRQLFNEVFEGMDAKFRQLCTIYWHRDTFEEKFGDGLAKLISQLRSSCLDDGDLLIYLQEKGSDAGGFTDATRGDLSASMGAG